MAPSSPSGFPGREGRAGVELPSVEPNCLCAESCFWGGGCCLLSSALVSKKEMKDPTT